MTAQNEEKMRDEFEKFAVSKDYRVGRYRAEDGGDYVATNVNELWMFWQAAIAKGEQERKQLLDSFAETQHNQAQLIRDYQANIEESQKREDSLKESFNEMLKQEMRETNKAHDLRQVAQARLAESQKREAELQEYKRTHSSYDDRSRVGMGLEIIKLQAELAKYKNVKPEAYRCWTKNLVWLSEKPEDDGWEGSGYKPLYAHPDNAKD